MERERIQAYDYGEWLRQWNGPGQQSFELAVQLLFCLPNVVAPLGQTIDIFCPSYLKVLPGYFRALYHAMNLTMTEDEKGLIDKARRAVTLLLDRCSSIMNHSLPLVRLGRSGYWDWSEYRGMPSRLLEYFAHSRSYGTNDKERQVASQCVHVLSYQEGERRKYGPRDSTKPFSWPNFQTEPHKTQLLRAIIIHLDVRYLDGLSDLLDDFFALLCDARDYQYACRAFGTYPRKAKQEWPKLDLNKIIPEIHRLGLFLDKPRDEILSPFELEEARKLGH